MTPYFSDFVLANGINQHYYRAAPQGGRFPVVLLHGLTDNGLCWVRIADALRDTYDVIMPDTRGHGQTDKPASGYSLAERASDVAALIDALALDRPALMGHSLGGQAATAVAALYPDKVRAIILEDPAWRAQDGDPKESAARARGWGENLQRSQSMSRAALIEDARQENPRWPEEELGPWADSKFEMSRHALEEIVTSTGGPGWRALLPKVQCPILLLRAEPEHGSIVDSAMTQEAAGLWKNGRDVYIAGAGHCIHREEFEPVAEAVKTFLNELA